ncbi:HDOD domain-containing protein [Xanthomonas cerealis pv. cerealis]|uniref:HDOD domain-containing protein n=1 Tax=Xanthomonas cerealis pv. cerealis TaxID=152263 RepID=A0A514EDV2_9XANT|nr:HDOD domain-containing protein [Xanthomonas translucens]QDI04194.1 HDOD domain-containing protein [Xanthomonas translucens pv. cerealis]
MKMIVPSMWIAGVAVALLLGIGGWMWRRGRQRGTAVPTVVVQPAAMSAHSAAAEDAGADAAITVESGHGVAAAAAELSAEQEASLLLRLYALAFAGVPAPEPSAASRAAQAEVVTAAVAVLARLDAHPRYTPRRPQLLPQLTRAINDPNADAQAIAAILGQDPALAGNLLRIANSTAYRRQAEPIENLERAVALLGTKGLRQIVLAALLQPVIADDGSVFGRCAALLWEHTLLSAKAMAGDAKAMGRDDPNAVQLLALLYGLGAVAVVQVLRDAYAKHPGMHADPELIAGMLEKWSAACAKAISTDWGLSTRLQRALEQHGDAAAIQPAKTLARSLRRNRALAAAAMLAVYE